MKDEIESDKAYLRIGQKTGCFSIPFQSIRHANKTNMPNFLDIPGQFPTGCCYESMPVQVTIQTRWR
jgi:hypothetical protein